MRRVAWSRILVITALVFIALAVFFMRLGASDEGVYAYVGSEAVSTAELERAYAQRSPVQENLSIDEYFDETYAPRIMILLEASELGLEVTDEEVDEWVMMINRTLATQNVTFETYLEDLNVTREELRRDIWSSTLLDKALDVLVAREVMVSAAEVEAAYDAAGYADRGIPLEVARNEIGPVLLREKQEARLREVIAQLEERYDVRRV